MQPKSPSSHIMFINQLYKVNPNFYIKVDENEVITINYGEESFTFDVRDYYFRKYKFPSILEELDLISTENFKTFKTGNLLKLLKLFEEKERYEKCAAIKAILDERGEDSRIHKEDK